MSEELKKLSTVKNDQVVELVRIDAGQELNSRLTVMGLVPNIEIKVINNGHPGPFIVSVKNSRIVIGRGMADKILVR